MKININGQCVLIDDDDHAMVSSMNWKLDRRKYTTYAVSSNRKSIPMHRLIMRATKGVHIDHINGCGYDNRKSNLRISTNSLNQANRMNLTSNTSGYRGVTFNKSCCKWQASIKVNGKSIYLGVYNDKLCAANAYDVAAVKYFGSFARPNKPRPKDAKPKDT